MPYVPGCPIPAIDQAVIDATREFCEDTNVYQKTIGATGNAPDDDFPFVFPFTLDATPGGDYYIASVDLTDYTDLDGYDPIKPTYFMSDSVETRLVHWNLDNEITDLDYIVKTGTRFYRFADTDTMEIFPYFTEAEAEVNMVIRLAMKPEDDTTLTLDDRFYDDWKRAIIYLTTSQLQAIPNREWTDYKQAQLNMARYDAERSKVNFERRGCNMSRTIKNGFI